MFTPKQLALSALIAAAFATTTFAQQGNTSRDADRPAASSTDRRDGSSAAAERPATSPSTTDQRTATTAERNAPKAKDRGDNANNELHRADRRFVERTAQRNQAEIELGKLAQQKAQNAEVKKFAADMVQDHTKAGEELKSAVGSKPVKMPTELDREHKRLSDNLNKLEGAEFDRKYMTEMVRDHEKTLKDLQKQAKDAKDPQIKAFAEKTAQSVQQHLDHAKQVADAVGGNRGGRDNKSARATGTTPRDAGTGSTADRSSERRDSAAGATTSSTKRETPANKEDNKTQTRQ